MKPDKKVCLYCGKQVDGKKKYCDDAHRMAYARKGEHLPEHEQTEQPNPNIPPGLTKTDRTFYIRAMRDFGEPYYNFEGTGFKDWKPKTDKCDWCQKEFTTNMPLNRYCSYEHSVAFRKG